MSAQGITIDAALDRFLDSQRTRLAPRTFRRYEEVVGLLAHCLNNYGYTGLSELERKRFDYAYSAGDEQAFCHLFGPERIFGSLSEFLGYFMIRKVAGGQELLRAAWGQRPVQVGGPLAGRSALLRA